MIHYNMLFAAPGTMVDERAITAQKLRTLNVTVLYPPTLTGEYQVRSANW